MTIKADRNNNIVNCLSTEKYKKKLRHRTYIGHASLQIYHGLPISIRA